MAEKLTPQQYEAVHNRGGRLLVSAAAGSGKTKVLVDRLLGYLTDPGDPANLDEFLIITYTKMAAAELRAKIAAKLSEQIALNPGNRHLQQQMQRLYLTKISTVHAFCADLLREYAYLTDVPADFSVADENECFELQTQALQLVLEQAYQEDGQDEDFQAFVNTQGFGRDDRQIPEILLKVYNSARCHLNPEQWLAWCVSCTDVEEVTDASQTVFGKFLMDDLHAYLQLQINAMDQCAQAASVSEGMEKPAALLQDTVNQLVYLSQADTWDEIIHRKNIEYGTLAFRKKSVDLELAERIKAVRNACKTGLERKLRSFATSNDQALQDLRASASAARGLEKLVIRFTQEYTRRKKMRHILDFGDLEHKTLDLLLGKKRTGATLLATEIGSRFREIMVDEYQDSNGVQDAIFDALTQKKQNCFMVGDVKQSIYRFRLADPGIFLDKYNSFVPAAVARKGEGRKVLLSSNFRSSNGILQGVNDVFCYCMSPEVGGLVYGQEEMLREGIPHISIPEPEVELYGIDVCEDTYDEEASFAAKKILELLDGNHMIRQGENLRPIRPDDIVILLRSPGSIGGQFVYALESRGIRCNTGNTLDLLQTEEVSTLCSLLQIICNPLQDIPLIAVLTSRVFGFTADDLAVIRSTRRRSSFYDALKAQENDKSRRFMQILDELRSDARLYSLSQLLQSIFIRTSMDSIFGAMADGLERKENLYTFCQLAASFEAGGRKHLLQFLEHLEALGQKGLANPNERQNQGAVTIMSIHKSKGLEFPVVLLCGLSRGFNQESARDLVLCDKTLGLGLNCVDIKNRVRYPTIAKKAISQKTLQDSISEEMRVLYVAMTRARDRLIMTYAEKNLEKGLQDIALRLDISGSLLMTSQVNCPGDWVLQAAMQRTEAGTFFQRAGRPDCVEVRDPIWGIHFVTEDPVSTGAVAQVTEQRQLPRGYVEELRAFLDYAYPHALATNAPSKLTATQLKGRVKDAEVAENTKERMNVRHTFRKPSFVEAAKQGKERGTAVHTVMQFIRFEQCTNVEGVQGELRRLVDEYRITEDQAAMVDPVKLLAFFKSPIGRKLSAGENILREFKFSILDDGSIYTAGLEGEQVLLQGVVDCAIMEPDGITVIDFKTDHIMEENVGSVVDRYRQQVNVYAKALERIYQQKIKAKYLYLFDIDDFVEIQ